MVLKVEQHEETKPILTLNQNGEPKTYEHRNIRANAADLLTTDHIIPLDFFSTAITVNDVPLAKQCVEVLNTKLNKDNALFILQHISKHKTSSPDPHNYEPSAPSPVEGNYNRDQGWIQDLVDNLRNNCLLEIDKNADYILKQKDILDLDYMDLLSITTRDTLQVSSELVVYSAIVRWGIEEYKRRNNKSPEQNLRPVLGELVYGPRYGLMSKNEFLTRTIDGVKGPNRGGILKEYETEKILAHIKRKNKNAIESELPFRGSRPRKLGVRNDSGVSSACDKHIINFLSCWTAFFD